MAHRKLWYAMTNIGAINSRHKWYHKKSWHAITNTGPINSRHKNLWCHKKSWIAMKICDTQMACHVFITWKTNSY